MKKILCLIDTLGFGGAERQMIGLALFLKKKGYRVDLITYHDHDFYSELMDNYGLGTKILTTGNNKWSKLLSVRRHIHKVGGYDWVIAYKDGPAVIGCLLKMIGEKFHLIVSERNTTQTIKTRERVKFFLYKWADFIVPNSFAQSIFIQKNFPHLSDKVVTITNFTDADHFVPNFTFFNERLLIMTVARIAKQKNLLKYLEVVQLFKKNGYAGKVHFEWYGNLQSGEETYGEECRKKRVELGVEEMIDIHPATTDIVKHYQSCDIFCLPSLYEGFPNVVCEAMSCGKPIACSNICDNPHIVQENKNGVLFDPHNEVSMYKRLKRMVDMMQKDREEWGRTSRKIAEKLFSKESFVQKYIDLIEGK